MSNVPSAKPSPRIDNGILYWYAGDTFDIQFNIGLTDQDGDPITIQSTDTVKFSFKDNSNTVVKEFEFTNISSNIVTLQFDATATALFPSGRYSYDTYYNGTKLSTIAKNNRVVVE